MNSSVTVLLAEDDPGHATLVTRNLERTELINDIQVFEDGERALDFLFRRGPLPHRDPHQPYVLLLDIRMPRVDGIEVLRRLKADDELKKMPVIMLTTTDNPQEIDQCYSLGCSYYITKPIEYQSFMNVITQIGHFLQIVQVPPLNGKKA